MLLLKADRSNTFDTQVIDHSASRFVHPVIWEKVPIMLETSPYRRIKIIEDVILFPTNLLELTPNLLDHQQAARTGWLHADYTASTIYSTIDDRKQEKVDRFQTRVMATQSGEMLRYI